MLDIISAGGLEVLSGKALPAVSASTAIFSDVPAGTQLILLTLRGAGVTMRFDGQAATAGVNGHDYGVTTNQQPYEFLLNPTAAALVRVIQNGGTATGWITYMGLKAEAY